MNFKSLLLSLVAASTLFAQWAVKTKKLTVTGDNVNLDISLPVLKGKKNSIIKKSINSSLEGIIGFNGLVSEAKRFQKNHQSHLNKQKSEDEQSNDVEKYPYDCSIDFEVGINDRHIFSILFNINAQGGGSVTGDNSCRTATFDVKTGKRLELFELLIPDYDPYLEKLIHDQLLKIHEDLNPDWEKALKTVSYGYYLEPKGLSVGFSKYSIAPGFMAVVWVAIPYAQLRKLIPPASPIAYLVHK